MAFGLASNAGDYYVIFTSCETSVGLNRKGAKAAKPFSNRNGRFEKTAMIVSV